jgi:hypothetical protein
MTDQANIETLSPGVNDELLQAARDLLYALDNGFLAYRADYPESAFVSSLRGAVESATAEKKAGASRRGREG